MSEKVLGFKEKDALYDNGDALVKGWAIDENKLIPVVSLEEHQKILNAGKFLKLRVIELELELKKRVSLEWLENWIKDYIEDEAIEDAWIPAIEIISAAKKQSEK